MQMNQMNTKRSLVETYGGRKLTFHYSKPQISFSIEWPAAWMDPRRWGVAQGCNCRPILDTIATLLEAQRPDLALVLIEQELNSQT